MLSERWHEAGEGMAGRRGIFWGSALLAALSLAAIALAGCSGPRAATAASEPQYRLWQVAEDAAGSGDATLSPDGTRFVTSSKRGGQWDLWSYELASGEWTRLTDHPADDFEARWSPDGRYLAYTSMREGHKDLWVLDLEEGGERRLTDAPEDDEYPAWSPDGRWIAYTTGPWEARRFCLIAAAGGEPRPLTGPIPMGGACTYHPDGDSLLCHTYEDGTGRLLRLWLDDGQVTPLTADAAWDYKPMASPDGEWAAFSRSLEGPADIWMLSLSTGKTRPLVESPFEDRWPNWDAAGERLFFHRAVDHGRALRLLDRQTGAVRVIVDADEMPLQGSFDPRGEKVVYCSLAAGRRELAVVDLATGSRRRLDTGPGEACFPRWSPDGEWIAFVGREKGSWHDGRRQGGRRNVNHDLGRWEVSMVRPDGSERVVLTAGVEGLRGLDGPLDWSPDGSRLVFHGDTDPFAADLYLVDIASREVTNLTQDVWFDESPSWSPDGRSIFFMSTRGGDWTWSFCRLEVADGKVEIIDKPDYVERNFPRPAADGGLVWSAYVEDGIERLVERDADGGVQVLTAAGDGARWPSYSPDGRQILYTTVEHRVEYWLVEHPFGHGSPMHEAPPSLASLSLSSLPWASASSPMVGVEASPGRSPVDLERR